MSDLYDDFTAGVPKPSSLGFIVGAILVAAAILFGMQIETRSNQGDPNSLVEILSPTNPEWGVGSGVAIGDGLILTATHVVRSKNLKVGDGVAFKQFDGTTVEGTIVAEDHTNYTDLTLIRATRYTGPTSPLACDKPAVVGQDVSLHGYPLTVGRVTTFGKVAATDVDEKTDQYGGNYQAGAIILSAVVASGMSGGPVFDKNYRVVATIHAVITDFNPFYGNIMFSGLTIGVPAEVACNLVKRLHSVRE